MRRIDLLVGLGVMLSKYQYLHVGLMKLYFTSHANVIFRWENAFKSFTIVYMDNENVWSSKKLKNAKFHSVYLHRPLQGMQVLFTDQISFGFV